MACKEAVRGRDWSWSLLTCLMLAACAGGGNGNPSPPPAPTGYTVAATVNGLTGSGLVLQLNGANNTSVIANDGNSVSVNFSTALASGTRYAVAVMSQPSAPTETCSVANGSGTVGSSGVTVTVTVTCSLATFTIAAQVTGFTGGELFLNLNGADTLSIIAKGGATIPATFSDALVSGAAYAVTVNTQPIGQTCGVTNGTGIVGSADVANIAVQCSENVAGIYTLSVDVTGLVGSTLVLQLNGGAQLAITQNGTYTFSTKLASGEEYTVTILTPPAPPPTQNCAAANYTGLVGSANVTNVLVSCDTSNSVSVEAQGVVGSGLTLLLNGAAPLSIITNGGFAFSTQLAIGQNYAVTVQTQPTSPAQVCAVTNGSGTVTSGTSSIANVTCSLVYAPSAGDWTWMTSPGVLGYGTQGVPSPVNYPLGRSYASYWTDGSGNLWMFGGFGFGLWTEFFNDLWKYDPSDGMWEWVTGENGGASFGTYGYKGFASPANTPGGRDAACSATDLAGNFWLFGGTGYVTNAGGAFEDLNDLWMFNPNNLSWTWMSGANGGGAAGVYGAEGTPSTSNVPGERDAAVCWMDSAGDFWLFGGRIYSESGGVIAYLNDLWEFSPSAGTWTWMSGSVAGTPGANGAPGVYGTKQVASSSNVPGARYGANAWRDTLGNLWLFGGYGNDSTGTLHDLNDLWKFTPPSSGATVGTWTWVSGSNIGSANGIYGVQGGASPGKFPGARNSAASTTDDKGNFWVFGGGGFASTGGSTLLNDLWRYNPSSNQWEWVSGSNLGGAQGTNGTPGSPSAGNAPAARYGGAIWFASGNFWLFGGEALSQEDGGIPSLFDDLWVYTQPAP
jgi:N-acetylneuraminic acid mutarotase